MHVIAAGPSAEQGTLTQRQLDTQPAVLNDSFAGRSGCGAANTAFRFDLVDTT